MELNCFWLQNNGYQRLWNSEDTLNANVLAAGGRLSSKYPAVFYHELGKGTILSSETLSYA